MLVGIPNVRKRPQKNFFLNHFAVPGYDPCYPETYIFYKACMFFLIGFVASVLLYSPVVSALVWQVDAPVKFFRDDFPQRVAIPLVLASLFYALLLSVVNNRLHTWNFAGTRPVYLANIEKIKQGNFSWLKLLVLHVLLPLISLTALFHMDKVVRLANDYVLINRINDFDEETVLNYVVIIIVYAWFLFSVYAGALLFLFLVLCEKVRFCILFPADKWGQK